MCISRTCFCQWATIICVCILSIYNGLWCALLQSFDPAFFQIIDSSLFFLCLSSVEGVIVHFKYTAYMAGISLYNRLQNFAMGKRTWKLHRRDLYTLPLHWQNTTKNDYRHFEVGMKQTSFRMCKVLGDDNTSNVSFHHECVHRESILAVCTSTMLTDQWMRDCTLHEKQIWTSSDCFAVTRGCWGAYALLAQQKRYTLLTSTLELVGRVEPSLLFILFIYIP